MEFPILNKWASPFQFLVLLSGIGHFNSIFNRIFCKLSKYNTTKPLQAECNSPLLGVQERVKTAEVSIWYARKSDIFRLSIFNQI